MLTTLLLIGCVVGLLKSSPWVFFACAAALLLLHPLALLVAFLAAVGGGVALLISSWKRIGYAIRPLRDRTAGPRPVEGRASGDLTRALDEEPR